MNLLNNEPCCNACSYRHLSLTLPVKELHASEFTSYSELQCILKIKRPIKNLCQKN